MTNGGSPPDGVADLVIRRGRVHLGAATPGPADWVAVAGGRIAGVGNGAPATDLVGSNTRVVDANGGLVLPGFQDAHVHPLHGGMSALTCDLHDLPGADAYLEAITT